MLELEHGFRVVDVHARLDVEPGRTRGRAGTPEELEREMHQAGIVQAVVYADPTPESYLRANNAVARGAVDRPFIAFARINGPRDPSGTPIARLRNLTANRSEEHVSPGGVERYAYDDRFHGFVIDPIRDGLPDREVLEELESAGLPVLVHAGVEFPPAAVEETLLRWSFPLIICHFGGYPLNREYMSETMGLLGEYDDCYVETSVVRFRDVLERALREHPDRALFGSGAPAVHPNVAVMEVLTLDVPEDAMRRTFSKNAGRIIPALGTD